MRCACCIIHGAVYSCEEKYFIFSFFVNFCSFILIGVYMHVCVDCNRICTDVDATSKIRRHDGNKSIIGHVVLVATCFKHINTNCFHRNSHFGSSVFCSVWNVMQFSRLWLLEKALNTYLLRTSSACGFGTRQKMVEWSSGVSCRIGYSVHLWAKNDW